MPNIDKQEFSVIRMVLIIILSLTAMFSVGSIFLLVLLRVLEEKRDIADTRRLETNQIRHMRILPRDPKDRDDLDGSSMAAIGIGSTPPSG